MKNDPHHTIVGLISDTHGLLRPSVHAAFHGVKLILHAGDVGGDEILDELRLIAPVHAVYGNTDPIDDPGLASELMFDIGGMSVHLSHGHETGVPSPAKLLALYPQQILIYGHTHRQLVAKTDNRLVVNPGAAGARRFNLSPSVARLTISEGAAEVEIVPID